VLSRKIYRDVAVLPAQQPVVEEAWRLLPDPPGIPPQGLPEVESLNFFLPTEEWMDARMQRIADVARAARTAAEGGALPPKVITTRYAQGLPHVSSATLHELAERPARYGAAASSLPSEIVR